MKDKKQLEVSGVPVFCSHTDIVKTDTVKPNDRNPNQHSESQINLLSKIIKSNGWRNPIVISKASGLVVKGHARLLAAKKLGLDEVPVDYQAYKDKSSELADMLADNRIAELAETSLIDVGDILKELDTPGFDMDLTGYDADMTDKILTGLSEPTSNTSNTNDPEPSTHTCPECGHEF